MVEPRNKKSARELRIVLTEVSRGTDMVLIVNGALEQ